MKLFTTLSAIAFLCIAQSAKAQEENEIALNGGIYYDIGPMVSLHHVLNSESGPQFAYGVEVYKGDTINYLKKDPLFIAVGFTMNVPIELPFGYVYPGATLRGIAADYVQGLAGFAVGAHAGIVVDISRRFALNAEAGLRFNSIVQATGKSIPASLGLRYKL